MTSHFYFPYAGNKNREMVEIYPKLNLDNVEIVVEPYAGTCAMSYHIWNKNKNAPIRYVLNDIDPFVYEIYQIAKDPARQEQIEKQFNEWIDAFNVFETMEGRKLFYLSIKEKNTFESKLFISKIYQMRAGLCPTIPNTKKAGYFYFKKAPVHEFFNTANITFTNNCGLSTYNEYRKEAKALILLDPPYLLSEITYYQNSSGVKIYEYLGDNKMDDEPAKIYLIVENTWIMRLLFKNLMIHQYPKKYENKHTKTIHAIFSNIKLS